VRSSLLNEKRYDPHSAALSNSHTGSHTSQRCQARNMRTASLARSVLVSRRPRNSWHAISLLKEAILRFLDSGTKGFEIVAWSRR
jgi:hypothetical protein